MAVLVASVGAALFAQFARGALCLDGTHSACHSGNLGAAELMAQTVLAPLGILPAALAVWLAWRRRAVAALVVTVLVVALYAYWVVLLDEATHP